MWGEAVLLLAPRWPRRSSRKLKSFSRDAVNAPAERARAFDFLNLGVREAQHLAQDFLRVLAQQRRPPHLGRRVRQFDRIPDGDVLAARRMIDLDKRARRVKRLVLHDLF